VNSIGKGYVGNLFHVTLRFGSPEICKQCSQVKRWKATRAARRNKFKI